MAEFVERRFAQELRNFLAVDKELTEIEGFSSKENPGQQNALILTGKLKIGNVVDEEYKFRITCYQDKPNKKVTLQIERFLKEKFHPFVRIDWNPLRYHNNEEKYMKNISDADDIPRRVRSSHIHGLEDNLSLGVAGILAKLPIARPLPKNPENWQEIINLSSDLLSIKNLGIVREPPWSETLI